MARCLSYLLFQISLICTLTQQSAEAPCGGVSYQCTAGLAFIQKQSALKRGIATEVSTVEEHSPGAPVDKIVHEVGTLLLQAATTQKKAIVSGEAEDSSTAPGEVTVVLMSEGAPTMASVVLDKYPGYNGSLEFRGSVNISVVKKVVGLTWSLTGVEQSCDATSQDLRKEANLTKPGSCGLHIHEGMSCDSHEDVGGHYYHHKLHREDPWAPVVYVANKDGTSTGSTSVAIGRHFRDIDGHAFVVHDHTGDRVACGLLQNAKSDTPPSQSLVLENARSGTPPSKSLAFLVLVVLLGVFNESHCSKCTD